MLFIMYAIVFLSVPYATAKMLYYYSAVPISKGHPIRGLFGFYFITLLQAIGIFLFMYMLKSIPVFGPLFMQGIEGLMHNSYNINFVNWFFGIIFVLSMILVAGKIWIEN